ncbi:MAG: glycoside hydrolase family 95 protein, partial [Lachnospiraceae bacterium]|nr:glycoside hydrolase family 95 protein [Lachnospiraceae bacterium]
MEKTPKDILYSNIPASWYGDLWKEAFPSGNGKTGISVYGAVKKETVLVNHCNLWHWGKRSDIPYVSSAFRETKKLLKESRYREADPLIARALLDEGYEAELYKPCPVGDICIEMVEEGSFSKYRRSLDMSTGEVSVSWNYGETSYIRKCFVSREKDIIVLNIVSSVANPGVSVGMRLHETYRDDTVRMKAETDITSAMAGENLVYKAKERNGNSFGIACRILECDGNIGSEKECISLNDVSYATLIFKVFGIMDEVRTETEAVRILNSVKGSYKELKDEHARSHSMLYHSAGFDLHDTQECQRSNEELLYLAYNDNVQKELYEKLWRYGRYLFISGTAPDML